MALRILHPADSLPGASAVPFSEPVIDLASVLTPAPCPTLSDEVVVVLLADIAPAWRLWGWWRIMRGARGFIGVPGLRMAKALGSGFEGGFGVRPSRSRQGAFVLFDNEAAADAFIASSALLTAFRQRSEELCVAKLRAWSSRGQWGGESLNPSAPVPLAAQGAVPVAALTRASIRPRKARDFWRMAPAAQDALAGSPGCWLAVGLGEAPLLRQATFSLWESVAAMDAYARSGAHLEAIKRSQREKHFSESMFVRFMPVSIRGTWNGTVYET